MTAAVCVSELTGSAVVCAAQVCVVIPGFQRPFNCWKEGNEKGRGSMSSDCRTAKPFLQPVAHKSWELDSPSLSLR